MRVRVIPGPGISADWAKRAVGVVTTIVRAAIPADLVEWILDERDFDLPPTCHGIGARSVDLEPLDDSWAAQWWREHIRERETA